MKCDEVRQVLQEWVEGELPSPAGEEVARHISGCRGCAEENRLLRLESALFEGYRRVRTDEVSGANGRWKQIEAALAERPQGLVARMRDWVARGHARQLAYASLLVAVTVVVTLTAVRISDRASRNAGVGMTDAGSLTEAARAVGRAEKEYLEAIRILEDAVARKKEHLDPALAAEMDRNLRAVDTGIEAARRAYIGHDSDPELAHYMLTAYRKKVELLQQLAS